MAASSQTGKQRTFLFQLSDEERDDPSILVGLASRLPQVRKSGDPVMDDEANMQRDSFARIVNSLWRNPSVILQCQNWLESRVAAHRQRASVGEGTFDRISIVRCLDEAWACTWISKVTGLRLYTLEVACSSDGDAWRQIFTFLMIMAPSLKLPPPCKDQEVLRIVLQKRLQECGQREKLLTDQGFLVPDTHVINWSKFGVYEVIFEGDRASQIKHRPSDFKVSIPDVVTIDKSFVLTGNWSDWEASLQKGPFEFFCYKFFPDDIGPRRRPLMTGASKDFDKLVSTVHRDVTSVRENHGKEVVKPQADFRAQAKAAQKRKSMDKAREVLQTKKRDINSKRTITFNG